MSVLDELDDTRKLRAVAKTVPQDLEEVCNDAVEATRRTTEFVDLIRKASRERRRQSQSSMAAIRPPAAQK